MTYKKLIPYLDAEGKIASDILNLARHYSYSGADELIIINYAKDEKTRDEFLSLAKLLAKEVDIPFIIGTYCKRFEDVKKAFYTGAAAVLIPYTLLEDKQLLKEAIKRFGKDKIIIEMTLPNILDISGKENITSEENSSENVSLEMFSPLVNSGVTKVLINAEELTHSIIESARASSLQFILRDDFISDDLMPLLKREKVIGLTSNLFEEKDIMKIKYALKENGVDVNTFETTLKFSDFKVDANHLIPVIVQDYKSDEVLMLAYMNEEAYNKTIAGGKMTYYSRSRQTLWLKGETSGHFQYVKELLIDCDKDTILAKVLQIGPACHTGNQSCFFTELMKKEYHKEDPLHVFQDVYDIILDRKKNPKDGSYTNYLFDQGIDKILKKCGEEATEITIAAKNPGMEELRYEIADYLYHLMVLMVECGLDWNDITNELAHRK